MLAEFHSHDHHSTALINLESLNSKCSTMFFILQDSKTITFDTSSFTNNMTTRSDSLNNSHEVYSHRSVNFCPIYVCSVPKQKQRSRPFKAFQMALFSSQHNKSNNKNINNKKNSICLKNSTTNGIDCHPVNIGPIKSKIISQEPFPSFTQPSNLLV